MMIPQYVLIIGLFVDFLSLGLNMFALNHGRKKFNLKSTVFRLLLFDCFFSTFAVVVFIVVKILWMLISSSESFCWFFYVSCNFGLTVGALVAALIASIR